MLKIIGKRIEATRRDTIFFEVTPTTDGEIPYILGDGDTVTFTLKENTRSEDKLIQKRLTKADYVDGNRLVFKIEPKDTAGLRYKDYWYDVEISLNDGEIINTIIPPNIFRILEEVSF